MCPCLVERLIGTMRRECLDQVVLECRCDFPDLVAMRRGIATLQASSRRRPIEFNRALDPPGPLQRWPDDEFETVRVVGVRQEVEFR